LEVAEATRAEAFQAAQRVVELLGSLERNAEELRRHLAREGDSLRARIGKASVWASSSVPATAPADLAVGAPEVKGEIEAAEERPVEGMGGGGQPADAQEFESGGPAEEGRGIEPDDDHGDKPITEAVDGGSAETADDDLGSGADEAGEGLADEAAASKTATVDSAPETVDPDIGTSDSETGTVELGTATVDSGTATVDSGTATVDSAETTDSETETVEEPDSVDGEGEPRHAAADGSPAETAKRRSGDGREEVDAKTRQSPQVETGESLSPEDDDVVVRSTTPEDRSLTVPEGASPEDDARRRVKGKSDDELAETYSIAVKAHADASKGEKAEEVRYWEALARAIVEEAAGRSNFDAPAPSKGQRRKRREAKRLKRLRAARDELLSSRAER
jgi:hypothetical protein